MLYLFAELSVLLLSDINWVPLGLVKCFWNTPTVLAELISTVLFGCGSIVVFDRNLTWPRFVFCLVASVSLIPFETVRFEKFVLVLRLMANATLLAFSSNSSSLRSRNDEDGICFGMRSDHVRSSCGWCVRTRRCRRPFRLRPFFLLFDCFVWTDVVRCVRMTGCNVVWMGAGNVCWWASDAVSGGNGGSRIRKCCSASVDGDWVDVEVTKWGCNVVEDCTNCWFFSFGCWPYRSLKSSISGVRVESTSLSPMPPTSRSLYHIELPLPSR